MDTYQHMYLRYGRPSADAAVALAVRGGGCQAAFAFHFYRAPQPLRVRPSHGPRYGSFALTVELEGGLQALSLRQARNTTQGSGFSEGLGIRAALWQLCADNGAGGRRPAGAVAAAGATQNLPACPASVLAEITLGCPCRARWSM